MAARGVRDDFDSDTWQPTLFSSQLTSCKLAIAMNFTAFVPYSVTGGCSLTGNTHRLLHVLCCLWLPSDQGILPSATIVLLGKFSMIQYF